MIDNLLIRYLILLVFIAGLQNCRQVKDRAMEVVHAVETDPSVDTLSGMADRLILFTPQYGKVPAVRRWGALAVIEDGIVSRMNDPIENVPPGGWVILGMGEAAEWMNRNLYPGVKFRLDGDSVYADRSSESKLGQIQYLLDLPYGTPTTRFHDEAERVLRAYQSNRQDVLLDSAYALARDYQFSGGLPYFGIHGAYWNIVDQDSAAMRQSVIEMVGSGIQVVFPHVIYDGYAIYPEAHPDLTQNPQFTGWDPLEFLMKLSGQYPISFVPWVEVYSIGSAASPLAIEKAGWLARSRTGNPGNVSEPDSRFFCPSEPAVDAFWIEVYQLMERRYGIRAILLDYLHYPESDSWQQDFCYCDRCSRNFKKEFGVEPIAVTPEDTTMWSNWNTYRIQQVNRMIRHIHETFPQWRIGVDILPDKGVSLSSRKQDWPYWNERGWIQALFPMDWTADTGVVRIQAHGMQDYSRSGTLTMPVVAPYLHYDAMTLLQQIDVISSERLDGFVVYEWGSLTPEMKRALKIGPFRYY